MNVLFVCTGNTCRSPMAEYYLKSLNLSQVEVKSAGIHAMTGENASEYAKEVCKDYDIDLHRAQNLNEDLLDWADLVLTMTQHHKQYIYGSFKDTPEVWTLLEYAELEVDGDRSVRDPFAQGLEAYQLAFSQIKLSIEQLKSRLT